MLILDWTFPNAPDTLAAMATPEQEIQQARDKRTKVLLAGGAVSLMLPLLGVVYIRMNEAKTARAPDSSVTFERRVAGEEKVNISQTVTIMSPVAGPGPGASSLPVPGGLTATPAPGGGSSLDFVKGGTFPEKSTATAPAAPTVAAAAPIPQIESGPIAKPVPQKGGKKAFNMPKLQGTKGFSSFKGGSPKPTGKGMTGAAEKAVAEDGDMAEMLKKIPGGASNPEYQKYLKSQGK